MKKDLYVIFDKLAMSAGDPFTAPNLEVAKRHFAFTVSRMPSVAKDCQLVRVGAFDDETLQLFVMDNDKLLKSVVYDYEMLMGDLKQNE